MWANSSLKRRIHQAIGMADESWGPHLSPAFGHKVGTFYLRPLGNIINPLSMRSVVHAACPHDCPDACGVLITVQDGRATRIQGDPEHPVTRGFLCAKVAKYLDRVYSPERVLHPMRRIAPKGPDAGGGSSAAVAEARVWQ